MQLHDWILLLAIGALVVWMVGHALIRAFFANKRRHQHDLMRKLMKGDSIS